VAMADAAVFAVVAFAMESPGKVSAGL
jgi:hypothetical protein